MAFGTRKGGLSGNLAAITNPTDATGSVVVVVGDLVLAVIAEQTSLTSTGVTDNLGNTYSAFGAGTVASAAISARCWYSRVTVAGTLTAVHFAATASADAVVVLADVFTGPFRVSPLDVHGTQTVNDITTPYTCPATGTLAYPRELIACWVAENAAAGLSATAPNTIGGQASSSTLVGLQIGSQVVSVTTTVSPAWTGTAPTADVLGTGTFFAEDEPRQETLLFAEPDPSEEPIYDEGLWQPRATDLPPQPSVLQVNLSFFDLVDLVTEPLSQPNLTEPAVARDLIASVDAEDDFQPEEGLDLSQPGTFDNVSLEGVTSAEAEDDFVPEEGLDLSQPGTIDNVSLEGVVAVDAEDDFQPDEGVDFVQSGPTDDVPNLIVDGIVAVDAEDDFVPEEGLDLVQSGSPDQFLAPEIGWQDAEDDFVPEEGLDLVQPGLTDAVLNLVTDGIVALDADDDFVEEGGFDLSQSGPTDDAAVAATTDVLQIQLSFYDLTDLTTESYQQPFLPEESNLSSFDGALTDVLFDFEERVPTDFAQPNLTEPAAAVSVDPSFNLVLSFFDLTDLVTESLSQSHLTEAGVVIPDLIESFLSEDDFIPEEGLDLTQPNLTEPFVAPPDFVDNLLSEDDFIPEEGLDLTQSNLTEDAPANQPEIAWLQSEDDFEPEVGLDYLDPYPTDDFTPGESLLSEDDFEPETGLDLSLSGPFDDAPILFLGSEITTVDAEDDFVPEEGIDLSLAFPPDLPVPPILDLDPAIIALDAEDDFVEDTGLDLAIDLPPDEPPPPPVRLRGAGYFKRPYKEIFRAIEKLAPWVPDDPAIARAVDTARDAVSLVAGTTADSDAPAGGLLQLHRTPPDLSAMTRALGAAARASTLANKVRHAQLASMHAQAVLQRLRREEEEQDEEDALCLLIY